MDSVQVYKEDDEPQKWWANKKLQNLVYYKAFLEGYLQSEG